LIWPKLKKCFFYDKKKIDSFNHYNHKNLWDRQNLTSPAAMLAEGCGLVGEPGKLW